MKCMILKNILPKYFTIGNAIVFELKWYLKKLRRFTLIFLVELF